MEMLDITCMFGTAVVLTFKKQTETTSEKHNGHNQRNVQFNSSITCILRTLYIQMCLLEELVENHNHKCNIVLHWLYTVVPFQGGSARLATKTKSENAQFYY